VFVVSFPDLGVQVSGLLFMVHRGLAVAALENTGCPLSSARFQAPEDSKRRGCKAEEVAPEISHHKKQAEGAGGDHRSAAFLAADPRTRIRNDAGSAWLQRPRSTG